MTENSYRRLYRSRSDRTLTGVCGGVARYLNVDPTAVRVGFVILAVLTGGVALLAYPLMWIIMPEEPREPAALSAPVPTAPTVAAPPVPAPGVPAPTRAAPAPAAPAPAAPAGPVSPA